MTIREQPEVRSTRLPDGRTVDVRVVVPDDSYLERSEEELVVVELVENGEVLGVVATPLLVDDVERARQLAEASATASATAPWSRARRASKASPSRRPADGCPGPPL